MGVLVGMKTLYVLSRLKLTVPKICSILDKEKTNSPLNLKGCRTCNRSFFTICLYLTWKLTNITLFFNVSSRNNWSFQLLSNFQVFILENRITWLWHSENFLRPIQTSTLHLQIQEQNRSNQSLSSVHPSMLTPWPVYTVQLLDASHKRYCTENSDERDKAIRWRRGLFRRWRGCFVCQRKANKDAFESEFQTCLYSPMFCFCFVTSWYAASDLCPTNKEHTLF